ncbi:ABC transporter ATP-binding protein [Aquimarina gracilis]|uniref:ABC transporter ATP-binding protein n=1 Tax=Aquimarina gracilis TaxID=874422 RepID=A0ABU5ZV88_9FLAO|nr:ABC transporter ATP-binding protein [Aquimarina gracilis]MEB3345648.1 ABC transporter ATP-binding protein [Aquimarina gracilis]
MIQLKNIEKIYKTETVETAALNNVNLEIKKGDFASIMGPSGCGKSTLLHIMGLLDQPTDGEIIIDGNRIDSFSDKKLSKFRNENIGFIFQNYHLIKDLTILENVELPLMYGKVSSKKRKEMAKEALIRVGLEHRMKHFPSQLSGGQKQRAAIARAIVGKPALILADEPTGNLDSNMATEIMDVLEKLNVEDDTTLIMVTHDERMASRAKTNINLFDGQIR